MKLKPKDRIHHCFWQTFGLSLSYLMLKAVTIAFSWTCNYLEIEAKGCCEQWWALSNYFLPLRTMGSQNWWFGDARTILYGVKHPYRRSPIFLRIRTKKELFSGKRFLTPTNNALLNASCKVGATGINPLIQQVFGAHTCIKRLSTTTQSWKKGNHVPIFPLGKWFPPIVNIDITQKSLVVKEKQILHMWV